MGGLVILVGALIVYFSTPNAHAPLLAPFLALLGSWLLVHAGLHWGLESWTLVNTRTGEKATHMVHADCQPGERQEFEHSLGERTRDAARG
jgi:hypothetical protein